MKSNLSFLFIVTIISPSLTYSIDVNTVIKTAALLGSNWHTVELLKTDKHVEYFEKIIKKTEPLNNQENYKKSIDTILNDYHGNNKNILIYKDTSQEPYPIGHAFNNYIIVNEIAANSLHENATFQSLKDTTSVMMGHETDHILSKNNLSEYARKVLENRLERIRRLRNELLTQG